MNARVNGASFIETRAGRLVIVLRSAQVNHNTVRGIIRVQAELRSVFVEVVLVSSPKDNGVRPIFCLHCVRVASCQGAVLHTVFLCASDFYRVVVRVRANGIIYVMRPGRLVTFLLGGATEVIRALGLTGRLPFSVLFPGRVGAIVCPSVRGIHASYRGLTAPNTNGVHRAFCKDAVSGRGAAIIRARRFVACATGIPSLSTKLKRQASVQRVTIRLCQVQNMVRAPVNAWVGVATFCHHHVSHTMKVEVKVRVHGEEARASMIGTTVRANPRISNHVRKSEGRHVIARTIILVRVFRLRNTTVRRCRSFVGNSRNGLVVLFNCTGSFVLARGLFNANSGQFRHAPIAVMGSIMYDRRRGAFLVECGTAGALKDRHVNALGERGDISGRGPCTSIHASMGGAVSRVKAICLNVRFGNNVFTIRMLRRTPIPLRVRSVIYLVSTPRVSGGAGKALRDVKRTVVNREAIHVQFVVTRFVSTPRVGSFLNNEDRGKARVKDVIR